MMHEVKILIPDENTEPELKALYLVYKQVAEQLNKPVMNWDDWYTNMLLIGSTAHIKGNAKFFVRKYSYLSSPNKEVSP